ncbi:MAG: succinyl-CoA synthetase subunit beta [Deltaproteobacteria bacterium]|nr:MAG: succinyl-CoA synthetase subunit beta [Deltaproteobacteria bacterium]
MARLYEYQGKEILKGLGIQVPKGRCVSKEMDARDVAQELGKPCVLKAQVWVTGRLNAGGIKFADTPGEAQRAAGELLDAQIKGSRVEKVLVEEKLSVEREFYAGIIVSNSFKIKGPVLVFSSEGGSSIEEVSRRNPERVSRLKVGYLKGVDEQEARKLLAEVAFDGFILSEDLRKELVNVICNLYRGFKQYDARGLEVNPLVLTKDHDFIAADCHMTIDDNSVFRHPELGIELPRDMDRPPTELEKKAWKIEEGDYRGTGYFSQMVPEIQGDGWLGFHGIGGGGAMLGASAFVSRGFKIANYADTSGDPPASKIYSVIKYILQQPIDGYVLMGACLANQEQWHHAHAVAKAFKEEAKKRPGFPVIILIAGNKEKEAHEIIREAFKKLPLRWELYGREYIYNTDFIADRVKELVKAYREEKAMTGKGQ